MIPGEKNVRDPVSIKVSRLRVLGILKKPVLKGLPLGGCLLENARQEADHGVCNGTGGDFAACEDVVPDRDPGVCRVVDPLIDPLIVAAEEDEMRLLRERSCRLLGIGNPHGCHGADIGILLSNGGKGIQNRLCPHHLSHPAAKGVVIELPKAPVCIVPDINHIYLQCTISDRAPQHRSLQEAVKALRKEGHKRDLHWTRSSMLPSLPARSAFPSSASW